MKLSAHNPIDVDYIAAVLVSARTDGDSWELFTEEERAPYRKMADAVIRVLQIRELYT